MNRGPLVAFALLLGVSALTLLAYRRIQRERLLEPAGTGSTLPAPVQVAPIESGELVLRRSFSGALEATAEFVVASKVSGRVERIEVDLADSVERGAVVVVLDDDEHQQSVRQAEADLEVARANSTEAQSALEVTQRSLERVELLHGRGVSSESALDAARADSLATRARLAVVRAQITRAESALETARIRLAYTRVVADWTGGDRERVVARRFVDEGETVSPGQALLSIVELDPITGVIQVAERDYAQLRAGQPVRLETQAWQGRVFEGTISRIAPVFSENTRQARVELTVANPDHDLKPGMFIRATVELGRATAQAIVPQSALTERGDQLGVFVVSQDGETVAWRPVEIGIREAGRVQLEGEGLVGRVVVLGQQLVEDGSKIVIPAQPDSAAPAAARDGLIDGADGEAPAGAPER